MSLYEELETLDPRNTSPVKRIEAPTPHKISVLLLVQIYLKVKKAAASAGLIYPSKSRRHFCLLLLKLMQYPDMTYNDLHNLLTSPKYKIEPLHLETFEKSMSELFSVGIDALLEFAEAQNIERMLAEELGISQFSVVGLYIRRVGVIVERLSFAEMLALYNNICLYYEKGVRSLAIGPRKRIPGGILHRPDSPEEDELTSSTEGGVEEEEEFVAEMEECVLDIDLAHQDRNSHCKWSPRQADLFVTQQCDMLETNELRALSPIELDAKLNEIMQDNPLSTAAYFLAYMNQVRLRDYFGAKDAMYRAFDRSPMYMLSQCDQKGFQYFCVNLAVLHANFGHRDEGLAALKEGVMLSQEIGDKRGLELANSWYCMLNGLNVDPLEKCLPDALEPGQVQALSLAIQFVVKHGALCGYLPLDVFDLLTKSEELHNRSALLEYMPDSLAMRSALWCLYGHYELSAAYAQLLMNLKSSWAFGDVGNSESVAKMLASLVLWVNIQGEHHLSNILLDHARMRFPRYPNAETWAVTECLVNTQQHIHRSHWYDAQCSCCQLFLLDENSANLQRAAIFASKRHFRMARRILLDLLRVEDLDMLSQVRALTLLSQGALCGQRVSTATVPLLIDASTIAASTCMEYELSVVDMMLAQALLSMNMVEKALQAATNAMHNIYTNGGIYDRSKLDFIFVRCLVAAANDDEEKLKRMRKTLRLLERAMDCFRKLEAHAKVLDILAFMAKTFDELGDRIERNKFAAQFKQYYLTFPISSEYLNMVY